MSSPFLVEVAGRHEAEARVPRRDAEGEEAARFASVIFTEFDVGGHC